MKERPRKNIRERYILDRVSRQSPPTPQRQLKDFQSVMHVVTPFGECIYLRSFGDFGDLGVKVLFLGVFCSIFPKFPSFPVVQVWEYGENTHPFPLLSSGLRVGA